MLQSSSALVVARLSRFPLALSEDGARAGAAAGVTLSQSQEPRFGVCSCAHSGPPAQGQRRKVQPCGSRAGAGAAIVKPPELMRLNAARGAALFVVSWTRGGFFTKTGSGCLVGRAGFPCSNQAEEGSEPELSVYQVCGLEHRTEKALKVSSSPAH